MSYLHSILQVYDFISHVNMVSRQHKIRRRHYDIKRSISTVLFRQHVGNDEYQLQFNVGSNKIITSSYIILFQQWERLLTTTISIALWHYDDHDDNHDDNHDDDNESPHRFDVQRTNGRKQEAILSEMEEVDKNQQVLLVHLHTMTIQTWL